MAFRSFISHGSRSMVSSTKISYNGIYSSSSSLMTSTAVRSSSIINISNSIKQQGLLSSRSFATKTGKQASSDLVKKIDENIKTEMEDPVDEAATKAVLDEARFTMKKNGNEIELFRTIGTYEVTTKFSCLDVEYPSADEEEEASAVAAELPVDITAKNTATGKVAKIEAVAIVSSGDEESSVTFNKVTFEEGAPKYSPYLSNLQDDFNDLQITYFDKALGLNGSYATAVVEIAENEEQKLYMEWMNNYKKFISA